MRSKLPEADCTKNSKQRRCCWMANRISIPLIVNLGFFLSLAYIFENITFWYVFLSIFIIPNNQFQKENLFSSNTFTVLKLNFSKENIFVVINTEENWFKNLLERKNRITCPLLQKIWFAKLHNSADYIQFLIYLLLIPSLNEMSRKI